MGAEARPSYRAMHKRVATERGPAWAEQCADCGEDATEWSYDHLDPDEVEATEADHLGARYSTDPGRYQARCKSCHVKFDRAYGEALRAAGSDPTTGGSHYLPEVWWNLRAMFRESRGLYDEPVTDLRQLLGDFVAAQDEDSLDLVALWIAATHLAALGVGSSFPRLAIIAPSHGAGKSTLLDFVARLSHRGESITGVITDALLPRMLMAEGFMTVCFDEVDKTLRDSNVNAIAILNAGWQRGARSRVNMQDSDGQWKPQKFSVFAPVALAGNGVRIPHDTRDRTHTVRLVRSAGTPEVRWLDELEGVDTRLRARLEAWAADVARLARVRRPEVPDGLGGRDRDRWQVLLSAAHGVGGDWPQRVARMALADRDVRAEAAMADGPAPNEQLAFDLFAVWHEGETFNTTADLVERLIIHNAELWGMPSGKPLTAKSLTWRLTQFYGVASIRTQRNGRQSRGYGLTGIQRVWKSVGLTTKGEGDGPGGPVS